MNNETINFAGQTKATNKKTIELPLLFKKTQTALLIGHDWMQQLKIILSSNNNTIQIQNIKRDNLEKSILKFQKDFNGLFYNNKEIKTNLSMKSNLKDGAEQIQQKGRPIPILLQDQVARELKRLIRHGYSEREQKLPKIIL